MVMVERTAKASRRGCDNGGVKRESSTGGCKRREEEGGASHLSLVQRIKSMGEVVGMRTHEREARRQKNFPATREVFYSETSIFVWSVFTNRAWVPLATTQPTLTFIHLSSSSISPPPAAPRGLERRSTGSSSGTPSPSPVVSQFNTFWFYLLLLFWSQYQCDRP